MSYYIPSRPGKAEYEEKRSRFIAYLDTAESEEEAKAFISAVRKENHDARHNCWCYIIRNGPVRYSDDGEPQGTAGIPMLEVFKHENVTNIVCVVTRYFGGVLLGTGGLARAYTKAAKDALDNAGISVVRRWMEFKVKCPYPLYDRLRAEIESVGGSISSVDYGKDISATLLIPDETCKSFSKKLSDISSGRLELLFSGEVYSPVPIK